MKIRYQFSMVSVSSWSWHCQKATVKILQDVEASKAKEKHTQ